MLLVLYGIMTTVIMMMIMKILATRFLMVLHLVLLLC